MNQQERIEYDLKQEIADAIVSAVEAIIKLAQHKMDLASEQTVKNTVE